MTNGGDDAKTAIDKDVKSVTCRKCKVVISDLDLGKQIPMRVRRSSNYLTPKVLFAMPHILINLNYIIYS